MRMAAELQALVGRYRCGLSSEPPAPRAAPPAEVHVNGRPAPAAPPARREWRQANGHAAAARS